MAKSSPDLYRKVLLLIIAVFFFAVVFKVILAEESTLEFTGANIYRAVYAQQLISNAGFASNLQVEGTWRSTGEQFSDEGRILSASTGVFTILYNGRQVLVGGPSTGSEDISAKALRIVVQNADVIRVGVEPIYGDYSKVGKALYEIEKMGLKIIEIRTAENRLENVFLRLTGHE